MQKPTEPLPSEYVSKKENGKLYITLNDISEALEYSIEVDNWPHKHDMTWYNHVVLFDGKFYMFTILHSYNYGIKDVNFDDFDLQEVELIQIVTHEWKVKQ